MNKIKKFYKEYLSIPYPLDLTVEAAMENYQKFKILLESQIGKQRLTYFRHIIRTNGLEKTLLLGKIQRREEAMSWLEGVKKVTKRSLDVL
ncbi:hypothetical protein LAZ67_3003029 [Cordylochernes scorpioides]|uniref:Uncharacterized protein n=1 Tax=Cordylochernes scorpioides TaxID=51811 RepID=A0ABY6K8T4_9ARAC|nr:hypothetical protein LAZ67_3003029 [Cordylochernes scorpioides]